MDFTSKIIINLRRFTHTFRVKIWEIIFFTSQIDINN